MFSQQLGFSLERPEGSHPHASHNLCFQALDKSAAEQPSVLATVVATAIKAAKEPIELLLPLNAFVASLRVAVLALQIIADRQHPFLSNNGFLGVPPLQNRLDKQPMKHLHPVQQTG